MIFYVDCFEEQFPDDPVALARRIADRHFASGDGIIFICPSKSRPRDANVQCDGSERNVRQRRPLRGQVVFDHGIASQKRLKIETGNGVLSLDLEVAAARSPSRVDMASRSWSRRKSPSRFQAH